MQGEVSLPLYRHMVSMATFYHQLIGPHAQPTMRSFLGAPVLAILYAIAARPHGEGVVSHACVHAMGCCYQGFPLDVVGGIAAHVFGR